jgi:hypothetical protein
VETSLFDSDPASRQRPGVRRYRVSRAIDDPSYVMIDLEFGTREQAEGLLHTMQGIWGGRHGLTRSQQARIVDVVEIIEL